MRRTSLLPQTVGRRLCLESASAIPHVSGCGCAADLISPVVKMGMVLGALWGVEGPEMLQKVCVKAGSEDWLLLALLGSCYLGGMLLHQ